MYIHTDEQSDMSSCFEIIFYFTQRTILISYQLEKHVPELEASFSMGEVEVEHDKKISRLTDLMLIVLVSQYFPIDSLSSAQSKG